MEQRDHYTKEVEALSQREGEYEVFFHIDFHQLFFEMCSFVQEMVIGVYYRPPGLTAGEKGRDHFYHHSIAESSAVSNDIGGSPNSQGIPTSATQHLPHTPRQDCCVEQPVCSSTQQAMQGTIMAHMLTA